MDENETQDQQDDAQAETDAQDTGDATGTNGGNTEQTFTQADVERMIADRLARAEAKADKDRKKAEADAEAKRLESQQEYQKLADQRAERISELEPAAERAERYEAALRTHLDAEREGLPDYIIELLDTKDVADQLEYITKNRDKLKPTNDKRGIDQTGRGNTAAVSVVDSYFERTYGKQSAP